MPTVGDNRIDELIDMFENSAEELADLIVEIPFADKTAKAQLMMAIGKILDAMRKRSASWVEQFVREVYREAAQNANELLASMGATDVDVDFGELEDAAVEEFTEEFAVYMDVSLESVRGLAGRLNSGVGMHEFADVKTRHAITAGIVTGIAAATVRQKIRDRVINGVVQVVGENGQTYRYAMDYYSAVVANQTKYAAMTYATLAMSGLRGHDLLRVSPQPSTIGDYCDEYKGKIVFIFGRHPSYPHISVLPGGAGAPFHPHCHHYMQVWDGQDDPGPISQEFQELATTGEMPGPNAFQKLWVTKKRG